MEEELVVASEARQVFCESQEEIMRQQKLFKQTAFELQLQDNHVAECRLQMLQQTSQLDKTESQLKCELLAQETAGVTISKQQAAMRQFEEDLCSAASFTRTEEDTIRKVTTKFEEAREQLAIDGAKQQVLLQRQREQSRMLDGMNSRIAGALDEVAAETLKFQMAEKEVRRCELQHQEVCDRLESETVLHNMTVQAHERQRHATEAVKAELAEATAEAIQHERTHLS